MNMKSEQRKHFIVNLVFSLLVFFLVKCIANINNDYQFNFFSIVNSLILALKSCYILKYSRKEMDTLPSHKKFKLVHDNGNAKIYKVFSKYSVYPVKFEVLSSNGKYQVLCPERIMEELF